MNYNEEYLFLETREFYVTLFSVKCIQGVSVKRVRVCSSKTIHPKISAKMAIHFKAQ